MVSRKMSWTWGFLACLAVVLHGCGGGEDLGPGTGSGVAVRISLQRAFPNLPDFVSPVGMFQAPNDSSRWFVIEQAGRVMVFSNLPGVTTATEFVDIDPRVVSGGETGLLGMAFHPDFPINPRVYLSYTFSDPTLGLVSRISEFQTPDGGATLDPDPLQERVLLTVDQPQANHKGGNIAFGPGGFLYIGFGDGGGGNDEPLHGPIGNGQNRSTLLGKMLRIDVSGTTGGFNYRIPVDNPFVASATLCGANGTGPGDCPEIFAMGFRNPWRWSFDGSDLWVADVGQAQREEVNRVTRGGNYGWRCYEGTLFTNLACGLELNLIPPIAEYDHSVGESVTGGFVYRGAGFPALVGHYVFGDFISGRIFTIPSTSLPTGTITRGYESGLGISSFGQGLDGELYVVSYDGKLYKIVP